MMMKDDTEVEFTMCYVHIYTHTYIYTYTVIHTHTDTHTHILSLVFMTTNLGRKILMTIVLIIPILQMKKPSHSEVK